MQNQTSGYESATTSGECSWEAVGDLPGRRLPPVPSGPGTLPAVGTSLEGRIIPGVRQYDLSLE